MRILRARLLQIGNWRYYKLICTPSLKFYANGVLNYNDPVAFLFCVVNALALVKAVDMV